MVGEKMFLEDKEYTCLSKVTYKNDDYYMFSNNKIYKREGQNDFVEADIKNQFFTNMFGLEKPEIYGTKMYF